jgi:hypothetical protein
MKKLNLALSFLFLSMVAWAQRGEPVNPQKDQQVYQGYTISLLPAMAGTYGYKIVKDEQLIVLQLRHPFTGAQDGLSKKEYAYKIAQWQIRQLVAGKPLGEGMSLNQGKYQNMPPALLQKLQMQGNLGPRINLRIPNKVAEALQININN